MKIVPTKGKGLELSALLRYELGIPDSCRWFEVRFALNEVVAVTCEFLPDEKQENA